MPNPLSPSSLFLSVHTLFSNKLLFYLRFASTSVLFPALLADVAFLYFLSALSWLDIYLLILISPVGKPFPHHIL